MKLAAIYNVWADWDILKYSVDNISPLVDGIIIVASTKSNYGEVFDIPEEWRDKVVIREPAFPVPMHSETDKRNLGLSLARKSGYTHFIAMDADECYDRLEFYKAKSYLSNHPEVAGLVCASRVYIKSPSLSIGLDTTLVPFIHKITPTLKHEFNRSYPFAWEGKAIRIDPTRSLNINSGVEWSDIVMDHYSWVRSDINRKIRNSTAKANIERTNIAQSFLRLKEGDICELYPGKPLVRVPVKYGLPEFYVDSDQDLQSLPSGSD